MADSTDDAKMDTIFETYPGLFDAQSDKKKVICKLTKHEIPYSHTAVENYIKGKKFQRLYRKVKSPETVCYKIDDKYREFFVPSKKGKSHLYCTLTKKLINNLPHEIEKHVSGYRFLKAKYNKQNAQQEGSAEGNEHESDDSMHIDSDEGKSEDEIEIPDFVYSSGEEEDKEANVDDDDLENESDDDSQELIVEEEMANNDIKNKPEIQNEKLPTKGKKRKAPGKDKKIGKKVKPKKMQKI